MRRACHMQHQQWQRRPETVATVVKMQQEIFKFVKRAAFPMHATIPQSPVPIPIPSTNPPLPSTSPPVPQSPLRSSSCHACVNLRGAQLIFCKCLETHFWTSAGSWKGSGQGRTPLRGYVLLIALKCSVQRAARATRRHGLPSG